MDNVVMLSLSYKQLPRVTEEHIRECELGSLGAKYIRKPGKTTAILSL
ncbi:hypothetical protein NTD78_RS22685 [Enterobacter bugandensis]